MEMLHARASAPALTADEILAQYDGKIRTKSISTESVLGVSDTIELVRHLATNKVLSYRRFPRDAVQLKPSDLQNHFEKLKMLEHPHISPFVDGFLTEEELVVLYEPCGKHSLLKYIQKLREFGEREVSVCIRQLAMALCAAHENGLAHGHLTPWSVHVAEGHSNFQESSLCNVKLDSVGLGLSVLPSTLTLAFPSAGKESDLGKDSDKPELRHVYTKVIGTIPPEVAWGEVKCQKRGKISREMCKMDIWGLGVIAFYLLTGHLPFMPTVGQPMGEFLTTMRDCEVSLAGNDWAPYPEIAKDCIASLLRLNGCLRPDASTVLKHPWIRLAKEKVSRAHMTGLLRNIFSNAKESPFKRMILRIIAHAHVPTDHRNAAERCFRFLDSSCDGRLGVEELKDAIRKFLPTCELADEDVDELFDEIDESGDGSLDFREFLTVSLNSTKTLSQDRLLAVFKTFDADGGGTVTLDEIEKVADKLRSGNGKSVDDALDDVKAEAGDGQLVHPIDFAEFVDLVTMSSSEAQEWWSAAKRNATRVVSIFRGSVEADSVEGIDLDVPSVTKSVYISEESSRLRRKMSGELKAGSYTHNSPLLNGVEGLSTELPAPHEPGPILLAAAARARDQDTASGENKQKLRGRSATKCKSEDRSKSKQGSPASTPKSVASTREPSKSITPINSKRSFAAKSPSNGEQSKQGTPASTPKSYASTGEHSKSSSPPGRNSRNNSKRTFPAKSPSNGEQQQRKDVRRNTAS